MFHESTVNALKYYGDRGHSGFTETAIFLETILSWWKAVNVKSQYLSCKKKDDLRAPITLENLIEKTSFFRGFVDWLQQWGENTKDSHMGLTKETFQAAKHTCEALASISEYLILKKNFQYFLPGKCQSDKLEGRYGQLRQMSGGNLYASVRQFLESDRTLRIKNLSKLDLSLADIKDIFSGSEKEHEEKIEIISSQLFGFMDTENSVDTNPAIPEADKNIIFYTSGYCGRTLSRRTQCVYCKKLLLAQENVSGIEVVCENDSNDTIEENDRKKAYINLINRGGLVFPSELTFMASVLVWKFYETIKGNPEMFSLLHTPNLSSQRIFEKAFLKYLNGFEETRLTYLIQSCDLGHSVSDLVSLISRKMFNIFSKNHVSKTNSKIHANKKRSAESSTKRDTTNFKVAKLQSETMQ